MPSGTGDHAWLGGRHLVSPSVDLPLGPSSPPLVFHLPHGAHQLPGNDRLSAFRVLCPLPRKFSHLASSRLALEAVCYVLRKSCQCSPLLQSEISAPALYSESTIAPTPLVVSHWTWTPDGCLSHQEFQRKHQWASQRVPEEARV